MKCSNLYIVGRVVFFGKLGQGIEGYMTEMRLKSSSDKQMDLESFIILCGVSIVPIGGILTIFVLYIVSYI